MKVALLGVVYVLISGFVLKVAAQEQLDSILPTKRASSYSNVIVAVYLLLSGAMLVSTLAVSVL